MKWIFIFKDERRWIDFDKKKVNVYDTHQYHGEH